jgi:hypothetical protein
MTVQHRMRCSQRGVTLFGLLFWAIVIGFAALLGLRVLPTVNEYFTIKRAVDQIAASGATTVPEIRAAFEKQVQIEYSIQSISSKDLEITKVSEKSGDQFCLRQRDRDHEPGLLAHQIRRSIEVGGSLLGPEYCGRSSQRTATTPGSPLCSA